MIQPLLGLLRRDGTVFSNQLFIQVRIISLSASSGLIASSIMNIEAPLQVKAHQVPVA
jgi:hypothetical protein